MPPWPGGQAVEWVRRRNPWDTDSRWIRTHPWRMYALGIGVPWLRRPARFVIVTPGRSGSELLTDLLNSHPDIVCDAEILRDRLADPERFVVGRSVSAAITGAKAYGFKVHCGHFGYQALRERRHMLARLAESGVLVILLRRDNTLAQAISSAIASRTRWHWRRQDGAVFTPLEIDPVEVVTMTWLFEESDNYLRVLLEDLPHLTLTYEADLADPSAQQATVDRVCALLGLPSAPATSDHVRFTPDRLEKAISNFDAVVELVRSTRFSHFLDATATGQDRGAGRGSREGALFQDRT